jgi:Na+/melibiose symporter-like transporter
MCMLTFYTPDFSYTGKLIYAYVSYTLLAVI